MSNPELYLRRGPLAFSIRMLHWTDTEAALRAGNHLADYICSLGRPAARTLYDALYHRQEQAHIEDAPDLYVEVLAELNRREVMAWQSAFVDWLDLPTAGHHVTVRVYGKAD